MRKIQLQQEREKRRVLEEALNVLAKEHHELEQSMASHLSSSDSICSRLSNGSRTPRYYDTDDDEFYDAFDDDGKHNQDTVQPLKHVKGPGADSIGSKIEIAVTSSTLAYSLQYNLRFVKCVKLLNS